MWQEIKSFSPEQTAQIGWRLGRALSGSRVIALFGPLGAGKTVFTQGLAQGLGITEQVTSPTFTLCKEYQGRISLYHIDAYRLASAEEAELCGLAEYFAQDGVVVVEWPQNVWELIPESALEVSISLIPEGRKLSFRGDDSWSEIGELICR